MEKNNLYKKKILLVTEAFDEGGTEIAMLALIKQLQLFECKIDILCIKNEGVLRGVFPKDIRAIEIPFKNKLWKMRALNIEPEWKKIKMLPYNLFATCCKYLYPMDKGNNKLYQKMLTKTKPQSEKWDLVFDFYGYSSFLTAYVAKYVQAEKKATWVHAPFVNIWDKVEEYFKEFKKIYCVSISVLNLFRERFPETKEKTELLYNLTDTNRILKKSQEKVESLKVGNKMVFLTVGRLEPVKCIDLSIKVAKRLKEKNLNFIWYVIGDGTLQEPLQKMIEENGVENCFILLGRRDNVFPYMKQCDIYIQTSAVEGYSTTILEARILRKIVVATDMPSNREQVINGETGYLVERTEEAFVEAIQKIALNDKLQKEMTENVSREKIYFLDEIDKLKNI